MDTITTIEQLKTIIKEQLSELIEKTCILVDAPYYDNVGDVLIWAGTRQYLIEQGINLRYTCSYRTCTFPNLPDSVTILFQGGGNLGDLYPEHNSFLQKIINKYPNNNIVILPQTIYFRDFELEQKFISSFKAHGKIHLCARDSFVFDHYSPLFGNKCSLVPDMAFYISKAMLIVYSRAIRKDTLFIVRGDSEALCSANSITTSSIGDVRDWPTMESISHPINIGNRLFGKMISVMFSPYLIRCVSKTWDYYASIYFMSEMVKSGVKFVSPYRKVITTRLHGCILSCLLGKEVVLIDNNYGKNAHFYDTWLRDFDNVRLENQYE